MSNIVNVSNIKQALRDWTLIIAMLIGVASYFIYTSLPVLEPTHQVVGSIVALVQPGLIFAMLFLTFCKVNLRSLRPRMWHLWLLMIQGGAFTLIALLLTLLPHNGLRVVLEGVMICLICPTATAAAVVTRKLGGDINSITTYTVMINLLAALIVPALTPYVNPHPGVTVLAAMGMIFGKVFPLLLLPLGCAVLFKALCPKGAEALGRHADLAFYLWAVALALAIAMTTRSIMHATVGLDTMLWLVLASFVACVGQFWCGWRVGAKYGFRVTAGQALGQKNTVLAIWLCYSFFTPVTAIAGGFYSIWHNVINTYQLRKRGFGG